MKLKLRIKDREYEVEIKKEEQDKFKIKIGQKEFLFREEEEREENISFTRASLPNSILSDVASFSNSLGNLSMLVFNPMPITDDFTSLPTIFSVKIPQIFFWFSKTSFGNLISGSKEKLSLMVLATIKAAKIVRVWRSSILLFGKTIEK